MGNVINQPKPTVDERVKYKLYLNCKNNVQYNVSSLTPTEIKKSNNVKYVYFTIKNIKIFDILNHELNIHIAKMVKNTEPSSMTKDKNRILYKNEYINSEDKCEFILEDNPIQNKIKDKMFYDIHKKTDSSKQLIIRYGSKVDKTFQIIYIDP